MMPPFATRTIEDVTEVLIDYRGKTPRKTSAGIKLITAKVIKDGFVLEGNHEYIAIEDYENWMRRGLPQQWDILVTTEAPLGEVAQLRTPERIALAQRVILLRGNPTIIDQGYYFQAIKSPFVQAELKARSTGTTVLGIKQSELRWVRIPYFPLPVQRKIAAILSAYDDLIEVNTRRIAILEEMARGLYREWFVRFRFPGHEGARMVESAAGVVLEGWEVVGTTNAIAVNPPTKVHPEGDKPFVLMNSLSTTSMLISDIALRSGNNGSKFKNGDTLFARITPCLENGKTAYVQFLPSDDAVACGSTEFIVLRSQTLCSEFVYLFARSDAFRDNAIKSMTGASGRQRVQEACFERFLFAHPDPLTLARFQQLVSPLFRQIQVLADKNAILRRTRDLLLPRLVAGAVDVAGMELDTRGEP